MAPEPGWVKAAREGDVWVLAAGGRWDLAAAARLETAFDALALDALAPGAHPAPARAVRLDLSGLEALDTVGALLLLRLERRLHGVGGDRPMEVTGLRPAHAPLLDAVRRADGVPSPTRPERPHPVIDMIVRTGEATTAALRETRDLLDFLGVLTITLGRIAARPRRLRYAATIAHIEQVGLNALPILGLLTFLIGVVLAYQGAEQLRPFGADLFVVNLLGISVLREIGPLLTAIIVAGRSGSAFTAQIGTMKVNQEIDALRTLGLDPVELLVVPRLLALMISLPLLAFYADIIALFGGAMMSYVTLDISFAQFIKQLQGAIHPSTFVVGVAKAPVFAIAIAMVGCYEGLKVSGSAESVGRLTTKSVVESIFLVIVLDALFSILFARFGV